MDNNSSAMIEHKGIIERLKEWFHWDTISEKLHLSKDNLVEIGFYFFSGLLVGFLLKRYAHVIFFLILFIAGLVLLDQTGLVAVNVNWEAVEQTLGIHSAGVSGSALAILWGWVVQNLLIALGFVGGFLLGIKFG